MDQTITTEQVFNPHVNVCGFYAADQVDRIESLLPIDKRVYRKLVSFHGHLGCILRVPKLAAFLGVCVRTVQYALRRLEAAGLIWRESRLEGGRRRSNRIHFLWLDSLFSSADCTRVAPQEEYPAEESKNSDTEQNEPQPRFAQRESASASGRGDFLEPLREAMQTTHSEVGRMPTTVSLRNAAAMHSAICEAVGKPVSIPEAVGMMESLKRHGWTLRKRQRWFWVAGMIAYAFNYFAAAERQTAAYRPEVEMPEAQPFTARTAFHDAADDLFEVAMA